MLPSFGRREMWLRLTRAWVLMVMVRTGLSAGRRWWVPAVLALAHVMVVLDGSIVNIALPSAQADLGFGDAARQWLVTGCALAFGSLLLLGGRLADFFGRRRMLVIGLVGFAIASALGGLTQNFPTLLAARVLQGAFGAILAPAALSLLATTFSEGTDRIKAFAIYGAVSSAGGAVGLLLGGVLTQYLSWRACLFVNLPIAALALLGCAIVRSGPPPVRPHLDLPGVATSVLGLVGVAAGVANAATQGWTDAHTLVPIIAGVLIFGFFVHIERRVHSPLLPLRVVTDRDRGAAYIIGMFTTASLFGVFLFGTYFLTGVLGFTPVQTGFAFLPVAGTIVLATTVAGSAFAARFGPRSMMTAGGVLAALGLVLLAQTDVASTYVADALPGMLILGLGLGLLYSRLQNAATAGVGSDDIGVASALSGASQQIGGSLGIALLSSIAAATSTAFLAGKTASATLAAQATVASFHTVAWIGAGLFLLCAVVAILMFRSTPVRVQENELIDSMIGE